MPPPQLLDYQVKKVVAYLLSLRKHLEIEPPIKEPASGLNFSSLP
jgi:hypothetical protein